MIITRIAVSIIALCAGVAAMAQEVQKLSLTDTLRIDRSVLIAPKTGVEKATMKLVKPLKLEGLKPLDIPRVLSFDGSRLDRQLQISGLSSTLEIEVPRTLETTLGEVMSQEFHITPNFSIISIIGAPSQLPFIPAQTPGLVANIGASYKVNDWMSIEPSVVAGQLMGSRFVAPSVTASFNISERFKAQLRTGLALGQNAYQPHLMHQSLNASLRLQYITPSGVFVYGEGFAARQKLFANLNQMPMLTGPYAYGFGGGVGYNIPGAGPISVGINYNYNPFSHRMEPVASVNLVGGIIYLFQLIGKAISGD